MHDPSDAVSDDEEEEKDETSNNGTENWLIFRDILSAAVIERLAPTSSGSKGKPIKSRARRGIGRKNRILNPSRPRSDGKEVQQQSKDTVAEEKTNDAEDLGEFIEYLATSVFEGLPPRLRFLHCERHGARAGEGERDEDDGAGGKEIEVLTLPLSPESVDSILAPLPGEVRDSLLTYGIVESISQDRGERGGWTPMQRDGTGEAAEDFLTRILEDYIAAVAATSSKSEGEGADASARGVEGCEICSRDHLPLTQHHLVPRSVAAKAIKRGWHDAIDVARVAWLCRACHSFVHSIASNEELAREWFEIERLVEREDVQRWAAWVGRVRWKAR